MFGLRAFLKWLFKADEIENRNIKRKEELEILKKHYNFLETEEEKRYKNSIKKYVSADEFTLESGEELYINYGISVIHEFGTNEPVICFRDCQILYKNNFFKINRDFCINLKDIIKNGCIKFSNEIYINLRNKNKIRELKEINGLKITKHKEHIIEIGNKFESTINLRQAGSYKKESYDDIDNL